MLAAEAELILSRGVIHTCDPAQPRAEAIAVAGGQVLAVGSSDEIEGLRRPTTRRIDLEGALVLPGLSDGHTHLEKYAPFIDALDLRDVASREEFRLRVRAAAADIGPDGWLLGCNWNEERWGGEPPDRGWIDDLTPTTPAVLFKEDLHQALCNGVALARAGIGAGTPPPPGGVIVEDERGRPNGILMESAMRPVEALVPQLSPELRGSAQRRVLALANSLGITHICDVSVEPDDLGWFFDAEKAGALTCRLDLFPPIEKWEKLARAGLRSGVGLELTRLGGVKGFLDGSLGSRTALMFEDYLDEPGRRGNLSGMAEPLSGMQAMLLCADHAGLRVALHAIGDAANRIALDMFERVRRESRYPYPGLRHRIEHAQHIHPDDVPRFAELGLVASCQPAHLTGDGCFAEKRLGRDRCRHSYPFRSLLDAGTTVIFGSDWTVADLNPFLGIWAAVTRKTDDGEHPDGWVPEQKLTVEEAVAAYTVSAARASGQEGKWGWLAPGLAADLVVLDRNIFDCDSDEIRDTAVLRTLLAGRQVYPETE